MNALQKSFSKDFASAIRMTLNGKFKRTIFTAHPFLRRKTLILCYGTRLKSFYQLRIYPKTSDSPSITSRVNELKQFVNLVSGRIWFISNQILEISWQQWQNFTWFPADFSLSVHNFLMHILLEVLFITFLFPYFLSFSISFLLFSIPPFF